MAQSLPSTSKYKLDSVYNWDSVTFEVEETLFTVPKYHFVQGSDYFTSTYGLGDQLDEHCLDSAPIQLPEASAQDFRHFLNVLYPRTIPPKRTSMHAWISVLKLSTLWYFKDVRAYAISQITRGLGAISALERVALGKEFYVSQWILAGYDELVKDGGTISLEDAKEIGMEAAVKLYICRGQKQYAVNSEAYLREVFADDLEATLQKEREYCPEEDKPKENDCDQQTSDMEIEEALLHEEESEDMGAEKRVAVKKGTGWQEALQALELKRLQDADAARKAETDRVKADLARASASLVKEREAHARDIAEHQDALRRTSVNSSRYRQERDHYASELVVLCGQLDKYKNYAEMGAFFRTIASGDKARKRSNSLAVSSATSSSDAGSTYAHKLSASMSGLSVNKRTTWQGGLSARPAAALPPVPPTPTAPLRVSKTHVRFDSTQSKLSFPPSAVPVGKPPSTISGPRLDCDGEPDRPNKKTKHRR